MQNDDTKTKAINNTETLVQSVTSSYMSKLVISNYSVNVTYIAIIEQKEWNGELSIKDMCTGYMCNDIHRYHFLGTTEL